MSEHCAACGRGGKEYPECPRCGCPVVGDQSVCISTKYMKFDYIHYHVKCFMHMTEEQLPEYFGANRIELMMEMLGFKR